MPASGKKETMSVKELLQRSEAGQKNTTHGAYAFRDRGEAALSDTGRSRLAELQDQVSNRSSAVELMKEFTAKSILIAELALGYVSTKKREGIELEKLAVFRTLPAFMNSASRALKDLIALLPDDREILDEATILDDLRNKVNGETEEEPDT